MSGSKYDVFISYRRQNGSDLAQLVRASLERRGYRVFLDVREMPSGPFDQALRRAVETTPDFVLLLTPGCLDRCGNAEDWFREEIRHALGTRRNVVPLRVGDFVFPPADALPPEIASIPRHHTILYVHDHAEAALDAVCRLLRSRRRTWMRRAVLAGLLGLALLSPLALWRWFSPPTVPPVAIYWHGFGQRQRAGAWEEFPVRDGMTMYSGDQFRIVFSPTQDCYVYLISAGADGRTALLYPNSPLQHGARCSGNRQYEVPEGIDWFTLDRQTGSETLYLIASYDRLNEIERLASPIPSEELPRAADKLQLAVRGLQTGPSDNEVRTRSGFRISVRGVEIRPDRRLATATLQTGQKVERVMQFVPGAAHAVQQIHFAHADASPVP